MRRSLFMDSPRASARPLLVPPGRLRFNIAAQIGGRGLTVMLALAQVAVALPYLGIERYGAWMLMLGVAGAIHIADFGIGLATQRAMAEAIARGDGALARGLARQGTLWLSGIALASVGRSALRSSPSPTGPPGPDLKAWPRPSRLRWPCSS